MAFPVSVIQLEIDAERPDDNLAAALSLCVQAIESGARLVLLPEAAVSDLFRGAEKHAQTIPGPLTENFKRIAGSALIALPLLERRAEKIHSACALIDASGVIGVARRTHLFRDPLGIDLLNELDIFQPGAELSVIEAHGLRIGFALGFDAQFPEVFRTLALKGADIVLCALNCVEPEYKFLSAMAACNRLPLAVANRVGFKIVYPAQPEFSATTEALLQDKHKNFLRRCIGGSAIIGAGGNLEAQSRAAETTENSIDNEALPERAKIPAAYFQEEQILSASFRFEDLRLERLTHPLLAARRPNLYLNS